MTVRQEVLRTIIENYPCMAGHVLHNASERHPFSTMQRLRELKKEGLDYKYSRKDKMYDFRGIPLKYILRFV